MAARKKDQTPYARLLELIRQENKGPNPKASWQVPGPKSSEGAGGAPTSGSGGPIQAALDNAFQQLINQVFYTKSTTVRPRSLVFFGAASGVGVTSIVMLFSKFLATVLYQQVLLIDANFTRPSLHKKFNCKGKKGFCEYLSGETGEELFQKASFVNCDVMSLGDRKLLNTSILSVHPQDNINLSRLTKRYDLVLLDCGPITTSPETYRLASIVDGVILVTSAGKTAKALVNASNEKLHQVGATLVGCVLNRRVFHIPGWVYKFLR